jgi:thiol-disulfide isomerase/thioredoxin
MRRVLLAVLYTALSLGANPQGAQAADPAALAPLRDGSMQKLVLHGAPRAASQVAFTAPDGTEHRLSDWQGRVVVLNFWATWCAPCRVEMPMLDALQAEFGGPDFAVVPVATGRHAPEGIRRFYEEAGIRELPVYLDLRQGLARDMAVLGLPVTVILDRDGQEIGRLTGEADWHSDSARAIVAALIAGD